MTLFRLFLIVALGVITVYTAVVIANHGLTLFPVFFGDMATMGWAIRRPLGRSIVPAVASR